MCTGLLKNAKRNIMLLLGSQRKALMAYARTQGMSQSEAVAALRSARKLRPQQVDDQAESSNSFTRPAVDDEEFVEYKALVMLHNRLRQVLDTYVGATQVLTGRHVPAERSVMAAWNSALLSSTKPPNFKAT